MNLFSSTTFVLFLLVTGCCCLCWFIRSARLKKALNRIAELENEMLTCHSEILTLHSELAELKYQGAKVDRDKHYPLAAAN